MLHIVNVGSGLRRRFEEYKRLGLKLDLTRGKPSDEQTELSRPMLTGTRTISPSGIDCRNYGNLEGLPEARKLFAEYLGTPVENTYVLGNSSLALMHDVIVQTLLRPLPGEELSWRDSAMLRIRPAMLCPVPGYDRHFAICERYGIDMIPVPMTATGPDMQIVHKELALQRTKHVNIVGMWCVPMYSNPTGITYSHDVACALAFIQTGNKGFCIFWDLAYREHHLDERGDELANIYELCREAGNENRVFIIGSTSKITFAGGGIAMLAASTQNLDWFKEGLSVQTIGPDKLNQLRHWEFLYSMDGIREHMAKHRAIIKPKFDAVDEVLTRELSGKNIALWNKPRGGYFVSLYVPKGCAKRTVALAAELGVKLTPAGAAFPYGKDPDDSHIRIAPTFPPLDEVRVAMEVVALCIEIAATETV